MSNEQDIPLPERFYRTVTAAPVEDGWEIHLDGRAAKTPARHTLATMHEPLAKAIADEWNAQETHIDPGTMPLTQRRMLVMDRGIEDRQRWVEGMRNYLKTDLTCYRATDPSELVARQEKMWGPYLRWAKDILEIPLKETSGIMAIDQSPMAEQGLNAQLAEMDEEMLCCLAAATELTGSVVLGLALAYRAAPALEIFEASRVDETFQAEKWGEDSEAMAREARLRDEFLAISRYLDLISGTPAIP